MLFAISGVAVPPGTTELRLTRFVTSTRLVVEYNKNRNLDDKLRVGTANHYNSILILCFHSS